MEQIYRIGIDHGYGNIKTAHHIFESGVIERESASELAGMTVEYEEKGLIQKYFPCGNIRRERLPCGCIFIKGLRSVPPGLFHR